jgi:hypothetical protein
MSHDIHRTGVTQSDAPPCIATILKKSRAKPGAIDVPGGAVVRAHRSGRVHAGQLTGSVLFW